MKISRVSLRNFKCFSECVLDFSKITLLTGENSSGKSSLISGILSALQSNDFPFRLSPNGNYVNLGDYDEIVYSRNRSMSIGIDIDISTEGEQVKYSTDWILDKRTRLPKLHHCNVEGLNYSFSLQKDESSNDYLLSFLLEDSKHNMRKERDELMLRTYSQIFELVKSKQNSIKGDKYSKMIMNFANPEKIINLHFNNVRTLKTELFSSENGYVSYIITEFQKQLQKIEKETNFISSFRLQPYRSYFQKSEITEKVGINGENTIDQILDWKNSNRTKYNELRAKLVKLNLISNLHPRNLKGGRFELEIKMNQDGVWASLPDVGYGLSQFLPILVSDLQLPKSSTLFISQPEIHLHPRAQADLADYFIDQVRVSNKRYVLETHSEYLLNRIRLAITKGQLNSEDVALYYFENDGHTTEVRRITLTKDGKIENAPEKFFETYMIDIMNIALSI